jgi:hypothetical protein
MHAACMFVQVCLPALFVCLAAVAQVLQDLRCGGISLVYTPVFQHLSLDTRVPTP